MQPAKAVAGRPKIPGFLCRMELTEGTATYRYSRSGIAGEQSSREFTPAGTSTRTKTTAVQFTGIRPTVPFNPRRHLQRFLRPAPSFTPPHFQGVSSRDVRCLESRLVCCLIQITIQSCRTRQLTCQCLRVSRSRAAWRPVNQYKLISPQFWTPIDSLLVIIGATPEGKVRDPQPIWCRSDSF